MKKSEAKSRTRKAPPPTAAFPIVGVGASAGGLEAFTDLLRHLPADTGMGFVLVQHLDLVHASALTALLARATKMPVREVTNNLRVEPDHIYVIPPNACMGIAGGVLKLTPRSKAPGAARSIDFFFEALAHDQRERAIGVVLSGTATDGTLGLEAVKAEGGVTFAQDESAKYDSMPRSAIAAGVVDFVLAPEQIAAELARIARHPFVVRAPHESPASHLSHGTKGTPGSDETAGPPRTGARRAKQAAAKKGGADADAEGFKKILLLLRHHCGVDFSFYRSSTIQRRVTRRLVLNRHKTLAEYAAFLKGNARELDALYADVLISVTSFFRNPEAFDALKRKVFPKILAARGRDEPVRVWVLGCSTGQEAYSLAMAFAEAAGEEAHSAKLQIFATDLNEALLEKARHGLYAKTLVQDISPERLRRFFTEEEGGWRVSKLLREQVVFARQNVMSDPPFSRMDLVTCRNLLIYLEPELQKKIFPAFHYALKPGGFLFLGASESVGEFTELFATADKQLKIFAKKDGATPPFRLPQPSDRARPSLRAPVLARVEQEPPPGLRGEFTAQREADRISVSQFAPPGVLVDGAGQVLQFRGATGAYLEASSGKASFDLLKMAREGLLLPLRAALAKAKREKKTVRREGVRVAGRVIALQVVPLRNLKELCFLVLFEEASLSSFQSLESLPEKGTKRTKRTEGARITGLERELAELNRVNADLHNLQVSTETPILLLTRELTIRRFTPTAAKIFNLLAGDVGRGLGGIRHNLDAPDLERTLVEVLDTATLREREVQDRDGRWFALRARPYLTVGNKVDGVIVVLSDISDLKRTAHDVKIGRDYAEAILRAAPVPFLVLRSDLRVNTASEAFYRNFQTTPAETEGRLVYEIGDGQWNIPALRTLLEEIIPRENVFNGFEVAHDFPTLGPRTMLLNARRVVNAAGVPEQILLAIEDITARRQAEGAVQRSEENYRLLVEGATGFAIIRLELDGHVSMWNVGAERLFGYAEAEILGAHLSDFFTPEDQAAGRPERELRSARAVEKGDDDNWLVRKDGSRFWANGATSALRDEAGNLRGYAKIVRDMTEHRAAHELVRTSESRKSAILDGALDGIITMDHEGKVVDFNPAAEGMFGMRRAEIVGQPMAEKIIPERLRAQHHTGLARYLETGEGPVLKQRIEVPALHAHGHEFPIELSISRIAGIEPPMFTATLRDITERNAVQQKLRESEERFRDLSDNIPQLAWIAEAHSEGQCIWFNKSWLDYTGATLEEMRGSGWQKVHHPEHAARVIEKFERHVREGRDWEDTFPLRGVDGEFRWFLSRMNVIRDESGKAVHIFGTNTDVTAQREAADALARAKEQVEAASRAKDDFLAALSHELRTPLTPVLMTAAALESDPALPIEIRDQLSMMRRNIELEARLIDDLLDITRISRGKLTIAPVIADLHQLLDHTAEIVRSDGLGKQVRIVFMFNAERHHALADPTRLQQVFWNLIKNALKFTPTGGSITVSTRNDDEGWIIVSVEDTGVGISAEALPHIFKAFEQGDVAGQHRYGGLGLGLAISQAIVEVHGGTIRADSQGAGYGATFTVVLASVAAPAASAQPTAPQPATARSLRLLVVEDHEATRTVLLRLLTRSGHRVTTAGTMHEALITFAAERFDAVISDLGLPDGSGLDLMREIQRIRPVPGIALSGYGMEDDLRQTKEAGFFAHLVKPVNIEQLRRLLEQLAAP